jgi:hypothetical protein
VDTVNQGSTIGQGTSNSIVIGQAGLSSGWVGKLMQLYDKFRINSAIVEYIPAVPFTSNGQIAVYWDNNPLDAKPSAGQISATSGNMNLHVSHVSQQMKFPVAKTQLQRLPWYVTQVAAAQVGLPTSPGQVIAVSTAITVPSAPTASTQVTVGTIWLDYTIELSDPSSL